MTPHSSDAAASDTGERNGSGGQAGSVSIERLADRVYRLLLKETLVERRRGADHPGREDR